MATPMLALVALARTLPLAATGPITDSKLVRALVGVLLAALVLPSLRVDPALPLVPLLLREAAMGAVLGLVSSVPLRAAEAAGALVDHARHAHRPTFSDGSFARLDGALALALFAAVGGPALWYAALVDSYTILPVGSAPHASVGTALTIAAGARMITIAIALAAPVLVAALGVEVIVALVGRAAPLLRVTAGGPAVATRSLAIAVVAATSSLALATALGGSLAGLGDALRDAARALLH